MRALITGASGFLGSHLTARLVADGHDVHVIVRPKSSSKILEKAGTAIKVHVIDATSAPVNIIEAAQPEIVFHLATHFVVQHTPEDVPALVNSNILFPCQLVDAMMRRRVGKLVNCSSAWQHYNDSDYDPVCLYAATKEAFLKLLQFYVAAEGLSVIDLTISDTYGPGDTRPKLFSALYRAAANHETLALSPGHQTLDIMYVDDVVNAFCAAADRLLEMANVGMESYVVRSDVPVSLRQLVAVFCNVTGLSPRIEWGARPYRSREMMAPWTGGRPLPGWRATVGIEEGIRRMHECHVRDTKN
jgi:nucleoside-diphosphate-sugar epimerase